VKIRSLVAAQMIVFAVFLGFAQPSAHALSEADLSTPAAQYLLNQTPQGQQALADLFQQLHVIRMNGNQSREEALRDLLDSNDPLAREMRERLDKILCELAEHREDFFRITDPAAPLSPLDQVILRLFARGNLKTVRDDRGKFAFMSGIRYVDLLRWLNNEEEAKAALQASSTRYRVTTNVYGDTVFEILPDRSPGGSDLNRLASDLSAENVKLYFFRNISGPYTLGAYSSKGKEVYVSSEAVIDGMPDESVAHELLHWQLGQSFAAGRSSIFYGTVERIFPAQGPAPRSVIPYGANEFTLEELATHSYQAHLYAMKLRTLIQRDDLSGPDAQKAISAMRNLMSSAEMTGAYLHEVIGRAIRAVEDGSAVISYTEARVDGLRVPAVDTRIRFNDSRHVKFEIKIPLMDPEDLSAFRHIERINNFEYDRLRVAREALHQRLAQRLAQRLKDLDQSYQDITQEYQGIIDHLSQMPASHRGTWGTTLVRQTTRLMDKVAPGIGFEPEHVRECLLPHLQGLLNH
jgi:hypothetical protein